MGGYISQDPIGLAGGNPTIYGYVKDTNRWLDLFGFDITLFRIMGDKEASIFESTGKITGSGGETTFATDLAYYDKTKLDGVEYSGTKYSVTITDDAYAQLQAIGVKDNSKVTKNLDMPEGSAGWMETNVRFKGEKGYLNIQMGSENGAGLGIINNPDNRVSAQNMGTKKAIDLH